jgi:hypothetical protein
MPLYIMDQIAPAFASVVTRDFVVQIAKATLDGVGAGTISGQKQQGETGMLSQPAPDGSGFMNFAVVGHQVDAVKAPSRVSPVQDVP